MLWQVGTFKIVAQGQRGVMLERTGYRVNLSDSATKGCGGGQLCVESIEETYRIYINGRGTLSRAQNIRDQLQGQICPETGKSYFRRRVVDDANLEVYRIKKGTLEETEFRTQYTECRTLALNASFTFEPIPDAELTDVITNDWTVTP